MHTFQPQAISNLLWAHASLGLPPRPSLLAAAAAAALRLLPEFT